MSIVRNNAGVSGTTEAGIAELDASGLAPPAPVVVEALPETAPGSGTLSINLDGTFSKDELCNGVVFNATEFDLGALPKTRVIVEKIDSHAIGSNVPAAVMVSANVFNSGDRVHYLQSGVTNRAGWTTSRNQAVLVPQGNVPIVCLMPNEYTRAATTHYQPGSGVDDGLVQRYGHLSTGDNLRDNIVSFPGEDYYYVAKDHVVLDIIERNWQALGQDVPGERVREGNWVKVSDRLVDKVLDELNSKVLKHMPLTNLDNLHFLVKADPASVAHMSDKHDYPLSMSLSLNYRSIAPELAET
jgi:hypothetical protein